MYAAIAQHLELYPPTNQLGGRLMSLKRAILSSMDLSPSRDT
jgi:hypothetical protein